MKKPAAQMPPEAIPDQSHLGKIALRFAKKAKAAAQTPAAKYTVQTSSGPVRFYSVGEPIAVIEATPAAARQELDADSEANGNADYFEACKGFTPAVAQQGHTPTPWKVDKITSPDFVTISTDYPEALCNGARSIAVMTGGKIPASHAANAANAALIVERVNGWDALVVDKNWLIKRNQSLISQREKLEKENDDLRGALVALLDRCEISENCPEDAGQTIAKARAALAACAK